MLDKFTAVDTLGLTLSGQRLLGCHIHYKNGKPSIEDLYSLPLEQTKEVIEEEFSLEPEAKEEVKRLYTIPEEHRLTIPGNWLIVSGTPASSILTRTLELNLTKPSDIEAVLPFQAEPLLPYPLEEATLDSILLSQTEEGTLITLLSIRNDLLENHLDHMNSLNIESEVVSCSPAALALFSYYFSSQPQNEQPVFVLHIGLEETVRVLASEGKLLAAHRFPIGASHLVHAYSQDLTLSYQKAYESLQTIDFNNINEKTHPQLHQVFQSLKQEMAKTLYALAKQEQAQNVEEILITGEGSLLSNLPKALSKDLPTEIISPQGDEKCSSSDLQRYAIPIGLALNAIPSSQPQVNFRQGDYAYSNPWKRFKQPLAIYFSFCFLLAFSFYFLGQSWISYKTTSVQQHYAEVLTSLEKPYATFETEFMKDTYGIDLKGKNPPHLANLPSEDLNQRMYYLQSKIRKAPRTYPLHPNLPRVSDVLAWLATHPYVIGPDPKSPLLQIETFSYTMTKRPQKGKTKQRYQAKVEIEFTTRIPKNARQFRDALMEPNELVDPKGEVKWTSTRDLYRTSFFLKDRTSYP